MINLCRFNLTVLIIILLFSTYATNARAVNEVQIKTAFLYNLVRMVEWPNEKEQANKPFVMCFLGDDYFGNALKAIKKKKVRKRPLKFKKNILLNEIDDCNLLFVHRDELHHLKRILSELGDKPIFTVSDKHEFAKGGGMANIIKKGKRVKIEINLNAAQKANFRISSRLLTLADIVE